jgi:hypothetical protein
MLSSTLANRRQFYTPIVDRACRTRRNALETEIAYRCIDYVIVSVMRNRADGAGSFAGIAANTDLRADEMLLF